jgi:Sugar kinases, ribokinase family
MRKIIGIGETILDIIFKNGEPHKAVPGGSVFNGLISLGRTGVPVTFISEIGNDRVGDIIQDFMKENNLSTEFIDHFPDGKSPISLAFLNEGNDASYLFYKDYPQQRLEVAFPRINENDIFIFGSYYALNPVLRERMVELLQYAQERKAIIYYDINFRNAHAHEAIRLMPTVLENLEYADIVRGSDEDLLNLFGKSDADIVYKDHIQFYCKHFIETQGAGTINLLSGSIREEYAVVPITPVSTIGAGDNFNAGILFGLLKYNISYDDLNVADKDVWSKIIECGILFATESCKSYDNYISREFAEKYTGLS